MMITSPVRWKPGNFMLRSLKEHWSLFIFIITLHICTMLTQSRSAEYWLTVNGSTGIADIVRLSETGNFIGYLLANGNSSSEKKRSSLDKLRTIVQDPFEVRESSNVFQTLWLSSARSHAIWTLRLPDLHLSRFTKLSKKNALLQHPYGIAFWESSNLTKPQRKVLVSNQNSLVITQYDYNTGEPCGDDSENPTIFFDGRNVLKALRGLAVHPSMNYVLLADSVGCRVWVLRVHKHTRLIGYINVPHPIQILFTNDGNGIYVSSKQPANVYYVPFSIPHDDEDSRGSVRDAHDNEFSPNKRQALLPLGLLEAASGLYWKDTDLLLVVDRLGRRVYEVNVRDRNIVSENASANSFNGIRTVSTQLPDDGEFILYVPSQTITSIHHHHTHSSQSTPPQISNYSIRHPNLQAFFVVSLTFFILSMILIVTNRNYTWQKTDQIQP